MKDFFEDKNYIDWWSIIHFSSGLFIGLFSILIGLQFWPGFFIALLLVTLFEGIEPKIYKLTMRKFSETFSNQISDIIIGMLGYLLAYKINSLNYISALALSLVGLFVILEMLFADNSYFKEFFRTLLNIGVRKRKSKKNKSKINKDKSKNA
ncbi:hypothetical protein GF378_01340 [Candidatus Pacearchaeota archaeon]|nr:hypothetical protein [Candidatus Pacearchaeota archaeon]